MSSLLDRVDKLDREVRDLERSFVSRLIGYKSLYAKTIKTVKTEDKKDV